MTLKRTVDWLTGCYSRGVSRRRWPGLAAPVSSTHLEMPATGIGWILFHARRYDEAIQEFRSELAVRPDDANALWVLGFVLICNDQARGSNPCAGEGGFRYGS